MQSHTDRENVKLPVVNFFTADLPYSLYASVLSCMSLSSGIRNDNVQSCFFWLLSGRVLQQQ